MATITSKDVQSISMLSKAEGRSELGKLLKWPPFDEELNMQESLRLDFLFDSLTFAKEKGFSWNKVAYIVQFTDKIIQHVKECEKITDILGFYNCEASELLETLGEREYKIFSSFVFETLLPHFKLYRLVFTSPRKEQIPQHLIEVEPPFDAKVLKETKPVKVWEYEKKIEEMENKEKERVLGKLKEREQKLSMLVKDSGSVLKKVIDVEKPLDKQSVGSIIEEVMKKYTLAATESIKFDIERLRDDLQFKLEKTVLPRPTALGPPPRYTAQAMKVSPTILKTSKSPKPESRASQRSKKK